MQQNNQLRSFADVISVALNSGHPVDRPNAEASLIQYRDSDPTQFFLDCSLIVSSSNFNNNERKQAGTVASRLINMKVILRLYPDWRQWQVLLGRN